MSVVDTTSCARCGHQSDDYRAFVILRTGEFVCQGNDACERRQKRDRILADMQKMAQKPYRHPVDRFSKAALVACGAFMATVIFTGLHYLMGF